MRKTILLCLLTVIPLAMHVHLIEFPLEVLARFPSAPRFQWDIFNWVKNAILYSGSSVLLFWGWKQFPKPAIRCGMMYFLPLLASSILSPFPEVVWFGMPNYLEGTVAIACYVFLFLQASDIKMDVSILLKPLSIATVAMFGICALQFFSAYWFMKATHFMVFGFHPEFQMGMYTWPLFGTMMNSNILGTFSALVFPLFLARRKWVLTFLTVLIAAGSQSRGAWFAMALSALYLGIKYRSWRFSIPLGMFAIGIGAIYLHPTHGGMKWSIQSSGRVYVWKKTMGMLSPKHLILGEGPGAYAIEFDQTDAKGKIAQGWTPETIVDRPHNFYLQVLHASGAVSLLALLGLFLGFLMESQEIAINASVLSYLVNVCFTDSCSSVAPLFWIILGTGVGRLKSLNKEKS